MLTADISITRTSSDKSRGFLIRISGNADGRADVLLQESTLGHMPHIFEDTSGSLSIICVGHAYARQAKTFEVKESLALFAEAFLDSGADGLRAAIGGGMFAIFVIDKTRRQCVCLTDFLACLPLFYRIVKDGFLIAINQFDTAGDTEPSALACAEYLAYGYLPYHRSLFSDVQRLGPGQVLTVPLGAIDAFTVSDERYPVYPALNERISSEEEAVDRIDALLTKYFSRLGDEPIAAGLSGGYDSRLIAAYCRDKNFSPVTYDNPQTNEAAFASRVAAALGLQTNVFKIPADAPSRYAQDFYYGMSALDSLESSHVFGNLDTLNKNRPAFIIDGHIGDVVFGGGFYSKLKMRNEPLLKYITGTDTYNAPPQSDEVFLNRMAPGYGRKIDGLSGETASQLEAHTKDRLVQLITKLRTTCSTDSDILEMILHVFRGASLAASGPITFLRRTATLCPFYDVEIFSTCMAISKSLRAGDRVYNALYRKKFPELAVIPKENTGGCASQSLVRYRLTHLKNVAIRKINNFLPLWMRGSVSTGGNTDDFLILYLEDARNQEFFDTILAESASRLSALGLMPGGDLASLKKDKLLYLRYVSLAFLLG